MAAIETLPENAGVAPPALPPLSLGAVLKAFALDAVIAIVAMIAMMFACGAAWGVWRGVQMGLAGQPFAMRGLGQPDALFVLLTAVISTAGAALLTYRWRRPARADERLRSHRQARRMQTWVWALMIGVATCLFNVIVMGLAARAGVHPVPTNVSLMQDLGERQPWLLWAVAVVLAPMYEELLFRRVLFGRLWAAGRPWLGAILSAALFALMHEVPGQGANGLGATALLWLSYGAMGLAFAWVYRRTGTLWGAIAAHAVNNLIACALLFATT